MTKISKDELRKMERCSPLLPAPGPEVVEQLLGHIYELEHELSALRETQIPLLKRAASMLAILADRDTKGRRTIDEFADELNEMRLRLEKDSTSALDDLLRKVRLDEAEWWFDSWDGEQIHGCSERLAALRAALKPEGK